MVIGGGQAGLATGYYLRRAGLHFVILEAGPQPSGSWPGTYDSLRLFTTAACSSLPGLHFPGDPEHYPTRNEVIGYLTAYAARFDLPVVAGARVVRVERTGKGFRVSTSRSDTYHASGVIAASGPFRRPNLPRLPGQDVFRGQVLHPAAYRRSEPFRGQRVVVVGGGNSAVQIGVELARVARVTLATRNPLRLVPQRVLGWDITCLWRWSGLDRLPFGRWLPLREPNPVLDVGGYGAAVAAGRPDRRPMFSALTTDGVVWSDGQREPVDTLLLATGYRPSLEYLEGLSALDHAGRARQRAGVSVTTPGLYYVGLPGQRTFSSATLRGVGADATYVVDHLLRYLANRQVSGSLFHRQDDQPVTPPVPIQRLDRSGDWSSWRWR